MGESKRECAQKDHISEELTGAQFSEQLEKEDAYYVFVNVN